MKRSWTDIRTQEEKQPKQVELAEESHLWIVKVIRYTSKKLKISSYISLINWRKSSKRTGQLVHQKNRRKYSGRLENLKNITWFSAIGSLINWRKSSKRTGQFVHQKNRRKYSGRLENLKNITWFPAIRSNHVLFIQDGEIKHIRQSNGLKSSIPASWKSSSSTNH